MRIARLNYGYFAANTYVLGDEGGPCLLVDLGDNGKHRVEAYVKAHHTRLEAILLTHGHFDHIAGLSDFEIDCPVFLSAEDARCLDDARYNASFGLLGKEVIIPRPKQLYLFDEDDEIALPDFAFKTIATPFHTPGSSCFYFPQYDLLFTGDTLFRLGIGRTDLPGGRSADIPSTLGKLSTLPPNTKIYPGHDGSGELGTALEIAKRYY